MAYEEKMKKYKPTTPGFRHRKIVDRSHLWKVWCWCCCVFLTHPFSVLR